MNIHIHIGQADADLLRLYKYLPYGLGKLFKNVIMSYYAGEKFNRPQLKYEDKYPIKDVKVYFSKKELEIIYPLLTIESKTSLIKNLARMKMANELLEICRPVYKLPKKKDNSVKEEKKEVNPVEKKQDSIDKSVKENIDKKAEKFSKPKEEKRNVENKPQEEPRKMPNMFMPQEY